ncbi:MAG: SDR family oxidoreductase [Planctomycetes bacterium]|nr:SDR family oxidoreductase [Planctomycetota bacterium]
MRLQGKMAIITGGSRGIGKAIASGFLREGARVAIVSRDIAQGEKSAAELRADGGDCRAYRGDIASTEDIHSFFAAIVETMGPPDIMVNNAGVLLKGKFLDTSDADWDKVVNTNLRGTYVCGREAARIMVAKGIRGSIINISSIDGETVYSVGHHPLYSVTKAGINMLTKVMAMELAEHGIRVNTLSPGVVPTDISAGSMKDKSHMDAILKEIPLGRTARADEMAGPAIFLASDDASYVTGANLLADGGWVIH